MKKKFILILITAIWISLGTILFAQTNPESVRPLKAVMCTACHGEFGISISPLWPNIASQKKEYLKKQIKVFKDGERMDPLMTPIAKQLTDQDIEELSQYFSTLKR